jgi:hypothetical protein
MLKKILASIGSRFGANSHASATKFFKPYKDSHLNFLYNLLFCDDLKLFKSQNNAQHVDILNALFSEHPDISALHTIADDETNEGRIRALAYNRLRQLGENVSTKKSLAVIVEVPLQHGLDVLAAFSEGGVRYLNHSGKVAIFEGNGNPVEDLAKQLVSIAQPVVDKIGPWELQRLPPPELGNVRMTFLVSDGLYLGEGPYKVLRNDGMGEPILAKAEQLLLRVTELGTK